MSFRLRAWHVSRKDLCLLLLAGVLSLGFALWSCTRATVTLVSPKLHRSQCSKLGVDGWIESGTHCRLDNLWRQLNYLEISVQGWRPGGAEPAQLRTKLCGQDAGTVVVPPSGLSWRLALATSCDARTPEISLGFDVLNPAHAAGNTSDQRALGVQLKSLKVSSPLGFPLVEPGLLLLQALRLFSLGLCVLLLLTSKPLLLRGISLVALLAFYSYLYPSASLTIPEYSARYATLWGLGLALLSGALLARYWLRPTNAGSGAAEAALQRTQPCGPRVLCLLLLIFACALGLRLYGVSFGLPELYHPDEDDKVAAVLRMHTQGTLNPQYFLHPSLLLYLTYASSMLLSVIAELIPSGLGLGTLLADFEQRTYLSGRLVSVFAGSSSVLVLFALARQIFGHDSTATRASLLSAAFLAFAPIHVTCSRYLKEDALLLLWMLLSIHFSLRAWRLLRAQNLLLAGLFAGLAMGTKYSGVLCALFPVAPVLLLVLQRKANWRWVGYASAATILMLVVFLCTTPYLIFDWATFIRDFNFERKHLSRGHTLPIDAWSQLWMFHLDRSLIPGLSWPLSALGLVGLGVLAHASWQRRDLTLTVPLLAVLFFYLPAEWVRSKPAPQPERYVLPCVPFMLLAAAYCCQCLWQQVQASRRILSSLLACVVLLCAAQRSLELAQAITSDTRAQLKAWMLRELAPGSRLFIDFKYYSPQFLAQEFEIDYLTRARFIDQIDPATLRATDRDYLLVSSLFYDRYFITPDAAPFRERVRTLFSRIPIVVEFSAPELAYGFHNPRLTLFSLKPDDLQRLEQELREQARGVRAFTSNELRSSFPWRSAAKLRALEAGKR
jgi:hypothetical protein